MTHEADKLLTREQMLEDLERTIAEYAVQERRFLAKTKHKKKAKSLKQGRRPNLPG
jgi:hypothetical protein